MEEMQRNSYESIHFEINDMQIAEDTLINIISHMHAMDFKI